MSKTVAFPSARQTTADDWVGGTISTETQKPGNTERRKSTNTEPAGKYGGKLARLTIDLPEELHSRFKAACAKHRTKMNAEVITFIEQWTQKHS